MMCRIPDCEGDRLTQNLLRYLDLFAAALLPKLAGPGTAPLLEGQADTSDMYIPRRFAYTLALIQYSENLVSLITMEVHKYSEARDQCGTK